MGQNITTMGRGALVKLVLTSQPMYPYTPLVIPPSVSNNLNKIERPFLWAGTDKVPVPNVKSTGKQFANLPSLMGSVSSSSRNFLELSGSVVHGLNGRTPPSYGWEWRTLATNPTLMCFMPSQTSPWEMELALLFGTRHGCKNASQRTLPC